VSIPEAASPEGRLDPTARIGAGLFRLLRLVERARAQHDGELDRPFYMLMFELVSSGPARVSALAEAVHSDPSTVSRQVAHLIDLGLLERRPDPEDRRAALLAVTPDGTALLHRARTVRDQKIAEIVADWPAADRDLFADLLHRFTTDFARWRSAR